MTFGLGRILGGCFAAGCAVALSAMLTVTPPAEGTGTTSWTALDHSELFLHDLTESSAVFVAAMVVAADGSITSTPANLNQVKFGPAGSKIVAAKSTTTVAMEAELDRTIVMNASDQPVMAYFETPTGLREVLLLAGEGAAVGEMLEMTANRYRWGCKCVCVHGPGVIDIGFMYCEDVFESHESGSSCDCGSLNTTPCWFPSPTGTGDLIEGTMDGCKSGFLPGGTGPGA